MVSLFEAIVAPPSHLGTYLNLRLRAFRQIEAELEAAKEEYKAHYRNGEGMLERWLRYATEDRAAPDVYQLGCDIVRPTDFVPANEIAESIAAWIKFDKSYFADNMYYWLDRAEPLSEKTKAVIALLPHAEAGAAEYGYVAGDPANDEDEEYTEAMAVLAALHRGSKALLRGEAEINGMKRRMGAYRAMRDGVSMQGDKWRPEMEEVETLYHATAFVPEIVENGFLSEPPEGRRGLGNYGRQGEISFTYDYAIAHSIVRTLKEMWMIAHGQITVNTILRWMKTENIDPSKSYSTCGRPEPTLKYTANLYRWYLAMNKFRSDPVMTYPDQVVEMMKTRKLTDIGIVAAKVRILPDDRHLAAEREFRVKPDQVVSITRVQ